MQPSLRSNFRPSPSPPKEPPCSLAVTPYSPLSSPWQPVIYFLSLWICLLWAFVLMESNNMWSFVSGFLHLAQFLKFTRVVAGIGVLLLSIAECYSTVWLYCLLVTRASADGHSSCLHVLAIINNAAPDICIQSFAWTCVFTSLVVHLGLGVLSHMLILTFSIFEEPPNCFPKWLHCFIIPPAT